MKAQDPARQVRVDSARPYPRQDGAETSAVQNVDPEPGVERAMIPRRTTSRRCDPVLHRGRRHSHINRKNVITLLMAIELMLLAVNTNFIAFFALSLGDPSGQVFVFFILIVAAAGPPSGSRSSSCCSATARRSTSPKSIA